MSHRALFLTAGTIWVCGGLSLVIRALFLVSLQAGAASLLPAATLGVVVGAAKGRFVFTKSSARNIARIRALSVPAPPWRAFPAFWYPLIASMIGLGVLLRATLAADSDMGALVVFALYLGIGVALLVSSGRYFSARVLASEGMPGHGPS